jgi:DNA-nicking Smr family endonuclease
VPPRREGAVKAAAPPNPGIDRRTAERLREGEIPIDRRIDLHGMRQDDAHAALDRFVRQAWKDGKRMLLVITGKGSLGEGVLRRQVPRWLIAGEHAARLLKIEGAQARHGGSGAFYVLLRRQRDRP